MLPHEFLGYVLEYTTMWPQKSPFTRKILELTMTSKNSSLGIPNSELSNLLSPWIRLCLYSMRQLTPETQKNLEFLMENRVSLVDSK